MTAAPGATLPVLESIESVPWSSLTFAGERHRVVVRLPATYPVAAIDGVDLAVAGAIVAVERADWALLADRTILTLDALAIAEEGRISDAGVNLF